MAVSVAQQPESPLQVLLGANGVLTWDQALWVTPEGAGGGGAELPPLQLMAVCFTCQLSLSHCILLEGMVVMVMAQAHGQRFEERLPVKNSLTNLSLSLCPRLSVSVSGVHQVW